MPRNSSGVYSLPAGTTAVTGTTIAAVPYNNADNDIASEITGSLPRNGSAGMTANLSMGGNQINSLANGVLTTDAATVGQMNQTVTGAGFPSGTRLPMQQSVPPVGWTQDTNFNDYALRITGGSVTTGGTVPFSTLFASTVTTAAHVLSQAELPNVNLSVSNITAVTNLTNGTAVLRVPGAATLAIGAGSATGPQNISATTSIGGSIPLGGSSSGHTHTFEADVHFIDFIIAQKS